MPPGLVISKGGRGTAAFQLFDPRERFDERPRINGAAPIPRIHYFGAARLVPLFQTQKEDPAPAEPDDGMVSAERLGRRLAALRTALEHLPQQARRLARWRARRPGIARAANASPLRLGPPPGYRQTPKHDVDLVLRECHALARDALREDTS
jgi:hypothetical protein